NCSDLQIYGCLGFLWLKCTFYFTKNCTFFFAKKCTSKVTYYKSLHLLEAHFDGPAHGVYSVGLEGIQRRVCRQQGVPGASPSVAVKEQPDVGPGELHND
ncbi:MAG: hypothetical protein QM221_04680, partial [Bacillota bacterium]|nr:hypothetical protein [Bacillota bacterium]